MRSGPPQPPAAPTPPSQRDVFLDALEIADPVQRGEFLDKCCAGNPRLRAAVESLLASHRDDTFLEVPVVPAGSHGSQTGTAADPVAPTAGSVIGRYKLLQQIGEGGAGTVFMAEQEEPVRRRVALKIIKAGMDTKSVIARFETERQALAMMDHPNIAKVLDGGATTAGRPYFVMELVRGTRITTYCNENHLSTRQRLRLFIQVCRAIQHAHQKGIIHRDIKPSNILVTLHDGIPVPKVIDFGIAKAIDQRLTDKTVFTEFQAFIGTPAYMSPEQAEMSGLDIDTRSDVYSLGVLLYEILTERTPFDSDELVASGLDGMRRTLREKEPVAPSTRVQSLVETERTTTAGRQRTEPARLVSLLSGDLDWIILKALEKDRTRRYDTALGLAEDVQCYLDDEPVHARPPSAIYRFRKLARRHRLAFAATGAFVTALILGLAIATWQFVEKSRALRQVKTAEQEQRKLREEAELARATEAGLRRQAEQHEFRTRQRAYAADINLAQHALSMNNLGRARELLDRQSPVAGTPDLRGWEWRYLARLCQSDALFTLPRQSAEITGLSLSADSRWLAASTSKGDLVVFDARSREEIFRIPTGHGRPLVAFAPHTPLLAFSAAESTPTEGTGPGPGPGPWSNRRQRIRLWDPEERRFIAEFSTPGTALSLAFSRDGEQLAVISGDGQCLTWKITDAGSPISRPLPGLSSSRSLAAISPDLQFAAYTLQPSTVRVCEIASGRVLWTARAAEELVRALAFSPDASVLASSAGFVESAIRLWDNTTGSEILRLEGHRGWVGALAFWPDGTRLASASADQTVRLWNVADLRPAAASAEAPPATPPAPLSSVPETSAGTDESSTPREIAILRGHQIEVWSLALSPAQGTLISGSKDGAILGWDTTTQRRSRVHITLPEFARAWSFTPETNVILTGNADGRIRRWTGMDFQDATTIAELGEGYSAHLFSPDANQVVALGPLGRPLRLWDLTGKEPIQELKQENGWILPVGFITRPTGRHHLVVRRFPGGNLEEWDPARREAVQTWPQRGGGMGLGAFGLAFTPDAEWWFVDDDRGPATLLRETGNQRLPLELATAAPHLAAFSNDGHRLAIIGPSGTGELWGTDPVRRVATISGFLQGLSAVSFSSDGSRLAIGSDGREAIKLYDADNNLELLTLPAAGSKFQNLSFSPDGTVFGARNGRGLVFLWRALPTRQASTPD
jgi:WD40 repeat protein